MDTIGNRGAKSRPAGDDALERLARVLKQADLDCACRENLTRAIESFERLEAQRRQRRSLDDAYHSRREILGLLVFLEDLDQIVHPASHCGVSPDVCAETAQVFEDIAEAARRGAASLRKLGADAGD